MLRSEVYSKRKKTDCSILPNRVISNTNTYLYDNSHKAIERAQELIPRNSIPPGWESIPRVLKRFMNSSSGCLQIRMKETS